MASAKSGKAGSAVSPADPAEAKEADVADPGELQEVKDRQKQTQAANPGSEKTKPHKPDKQKKSWIEIEMVDEDDAPVTGQRYRITLPDGESVAEGTLDAKGLARIDGIDPGTCEITFPDLDQDAWKKA